MTEKHTKIQNPVAKHARQFNKAKIFDDIKNQYQRKAKHKYLDEK